MKLETIRMKNGNEVSVCPERGGIITSLKLKGKEILYFDPKSLESADPIRGGIPILFPNAGVAGMESGLPKHGFARDLPWEFSETENGFTQRLSSSGKTKSVYLYDFMLEVSGTLSEDDFILSVKVTNTGTTPMPLAMGLHPYFIISCDQKENVQWSIGSDVITRDYDIWSQNGTVVIDNPNAPFQVTLPDLGMLTFELSEVFKKIWIWSAKDSNYMCIEPMMRSVGGYDIDPYILEFGKTIEAYIKVSLH